MRLIRVILASISIVLVTLLFLDFTGLAHHWFGFMARLQFLPAVMALNFGVLALLIVGTLLLGRVYCSVICPLGIMQDIFAWFGKKCKRNRYSFSPAKQWLRYTVLILFIIALFAGFSAFVALLAPYSSYGRIVSSFLRPIWIGGNNLLASIAEHYGSYAFYDVELHWTFGATVVVAAITLVVLGILAWRNGRTYCNTICPVGTILGFLSRFSLFAPVIDTEKCNKCGLCARNCKAACINSKEHKIDLSRCVACFDCIDTCRQGAISYKVQGFKGSKVQRIKGSKVQGPADSGRRTFLFTAATAGAAAALKAQKMKVDGGLAVIEDKKVPVRRTKIVPPGAKSIANLEKRCTACQLCVSACPNGVLRPSTALDSLMQPEASYEAGYCRPECTRCSDVCPTGAILPIDTAEKSATQVGHAVWVRANCVPLTDGVECGNCARHCPSGAIQMVLSDPDDEYSVKIPVVNEARCIGCGACENLCPARPFSAIYVEGHEIHKTV